MMNSLLSAELKLLKKNNMISDKLIKTLIDGNIPFFANDNISEYLSPLDLEELQEEVEGNVKRLLNSLLIDTKNDHNTHDTAKRVAKMLIQETLAGRYIERPKITTFPNAKHLDEMIIVKDIPVRSMCSHHMQNIYGKLSIGIIPDSDSKLMGLSKYNRLTDWIFSRGQIQEEAIIQLRDEIIKVISPIGVSIVVEAEHMCMKHRGVKTENTTMINSVMWGKFRTESDARREFLSLIK